MKSKKNPQKVDKGRYRFLILLLFVFVITGVTTAGIFGRALGLSGMVSAGKNESYELVEVSEDQKSQLQYYKSNGKAGN